MTALQPQTPGFHETSRNGLITLPSVSWSMKRPTRVPASTVVRMNRASNMIAKWYQKAFSPDPVAPEKLCDRPTASVGAPPLRATSVFSSTARAAASSAPGEMLKPMLLTNVDADCAVEPTTPAGEFIA